MQEQETISTEQTSRANFLVSYVSHDRQWAEWIAWHLEKEGYTTIVPDWDFRPGMNSVYQLHEATKNAERILVLLSSYYLYALHAQPEWMVAFRRNIETQDQVFFPVCVEKCDLDGLIGSIIPVELIGLQDERALQLLLEGVKGIRKKPLQVPRFPGKNTLLVGNIPDRNPAFVGREYVLKLVHTALQKGALTAITHAVIANVGSIGKTQVAIEYAYRYKFNYDTVFWIQNADLDTQHLAIESSLKVISEQIALPISEEYQLEEQLHLFNDWLQLHEGWLLVIDNIHDTQLLEVFLPSLRAGHILVTTRERAFASFAHLIELEERAPEEKELTEKLSQLVKSALYSEDNKRIPLKPGRTRIGRHPENDYVLEGATISDFHAVIEQDEYAYYLMDAGSEHGTFVNEERLVSGVRRQLHQEERILLGSYLLAYGLLDKPVILLPDSAASMPSPILPVTGVPQPLNTETKSQSEPVEPQPPQTSPSILTTLPQPSRLENPELIIRRIQQGTKLAGCNVFRPKPITIHDLPLPESLLTFCILSFSFSMLSAFFFYLCVLSDGDAVTYFSFYVTLGLIMCSVIWGWALCVVRDQQLSHFLRLTVAHQALLITTPIGFIEYIGLSEKHPTQSISFADLQSIIVKYDDRLNIAWLELFYHDGYNAMWDPRVFFGSPRDICTQILDAFIQYTRLSSPLPKYSASDLSTAAPAKSPFLQVALKLAIIYMKNLFNKANLFLSLVKAWFDA